MMDHIREDLTEKCSAVLLGYRRNCAASTAHTQVRINTLHVDTTRGPYTTGTVQLVIPEAFRALPLYILAMTKCKPLKGTLLSVDVICAYSL